MNFKILGLLMLISISPVGFADGSSNEISEAFRAYKTLSSTCRTQFEKLANLGFHPSMYQVPEDWSHPEGKKIGLVYYLKEDFQPQNTVIFFNGGPASPAGSSIETLKILSDKHPINFVVFDQRGTGCSSPFPEDAEKIALYSSRSIVNDAEALRKFLLGERKWKVFGQSYGGLIVQRYLETRPSGVSSAYSHGYSQMTDTIQGLVYRLKKQAELSKEKIGQFDDPKMGHEKDSISLLEKVKTFKPTICVDDNSRRLCGQSLIDSLFIYLGFQNNWFIDVLTGFVESKEDLAPSWQSFFVENMINRSLKNYVAQNVLSIIDITGFDDYEYCRLAMSHPDYARFQLDKAFVNECRYITSLFKGERRDIFQKFKRDPIDYARVKTNIQRYGIKYFLYAGQADGFIPEEFFSEQRRALGSSVNFSVFPQSGHEGYSTEKKIISDLTRDSEIFGDE
jgi:hypothetical protein